ncbi:MAG TPA: exodeoxyribonuclease VII large subunit [Vicinamibacterales bacterium]|jgi:exodeoxyribonuclease VII large subunit|nr:exodeoxyribonuclease VII large subunit [Vicinamibacterales bacterium]
MADLFDSLFEEDDADDQAAGRTPQPEARGPEPAPKLKDQGPGPARRVLSVAQLNAQLRNALETDFGEIWVEGELSGCKVWNSGHLYFKLKDGTAHVSAFMFRSTLRYLRFKPADGQRVIARGKMTLYEAKGECQFVCEHMEPHGLGALQLAFDQLKKRLDEEGLFAAGRKRPLPALPRKIGVVTSLDGAALRDIINVLTRRHRNAQIVIRPARVQGDGASVEIARGIKAVGHVPGVDVVIVGRGGGSIEDLWAFNEEIVARAIALCPVPVVSAVGHETDFTIADFVADVRAPTPSAAAEIVVAATTEFVARIDHLENRLRAALDGRVQRLSRRVHGLDSRPALAGFPGRVAMRGRHASELSHAVARLTRAAAGARARRVQHLERQLSTFDAGRRIAGIRTRLVSAEGRLSRAAGTRRHRADARLRESAGRLDALSPIAVLARGYSVCWNADGTRVIRDAAQTRAGDNVRVKLFKGELDCEVREVNATTKDTRL